MSVGSVGCIQKGAAVLEELGVSVSQGLGSKTPYVALSSLTEAQSLVTVGNEGSFELVGECSVAGGEVMVMEPALPGATTFCLADGTFSLDLDLSSLSDGEHVFRIRHYSLERAQLTDIFSLPITKITSAPSTPFPTQQRAGVNPNLGQDTVEIEWTSGLDSAQRPLENYEVSVWLNGQQVSAWASVGDQTSAQISIPSGVSASDPIFLIKIRGQDEVGQYTAEQFVEVALDFHPPTLSGSVSSSSITLYSNVESPSFSTASLTCSDGTDPASSGVAGYQYQIVQVSEAGADVSTVKDWAAVTLSGSAWVFSQLSLSWGSRYRVGLRCRDQAGNLSSVVSSPVWRAIQLNPTLSWGTIPSSAPVDSDISLQVHLQDGHGTSYAVGSPLVTVDVYTDASCSTPATGTSQNRNSTSSQASAQFPNFRYGTAESIYLKASSTGWVSTSCSSMIQVRPPGPTLISSAEFTAPAGFCDQGSISDECVVNSGKWLPTTPVIVNSLVMNSGAQIQSSTQYGAPITIRANSMDIRSGARIDNPKSPLVLDIVTQLTINGVIKTEGFWGWELWEAHGGDVTIYASTISGAGLINANGGGGKLGNGTSPGHGGPGGNGGDISVYAIKQSFTATLTASGGPGGSKKSTCKTCYAGSTGASGIISVFDGVSLTVTPGSQVKLSTDLAAQLLNVNIQSTGTLTVPAGVSLSLNQLNVAAGATLHAQDAIQAQQIAIAGGAIQSTHELRSLGNLTITGAATISVSSLRAVSASISAVWTANGPVSLIADQVSVLVAGVIQSPGQSISILGDQSIALSGQIRSTGAVGQNGGHVTLEGNSVSGSGSVIASGGAGRNGDASQPSGGNGGNGGNILVRGPNSIPLANFISAGGAGGAAQCCQVDWVNGAPGSSGSVSVVAR